MYRRSGFSLIEVTIVMTLLAIIALIVLPTVVNASRDSRETQLLSHLRALREAVALFQSQCGDLPAKLEDVVAADGSGLKGASGDLIPANSYRGPYFTAPGGQLPVDPMTGARDWHYEPTTGQVHSASTGVSSKGTLYNTW